MVESYESFYGGGASSLSPDYGDSYVGFRMSAAQMGFPGSPQTANQLGETVNALKQGVKAFEVSMLMPDVTEAIPKQHFKEMRALMKLSGVKPSVHGPMVDAAGFNEKGTWENEIGRADNERRMFDTLEKARILDPKGSVPVVFHSAAGVPGTEWRPGKEELGEDKFVMEKGAAINQETGQAIALKREYKFRPGSDPTKSYIRDERGRKIEVEGGPKGVLFSAEDSVDSANLNEWETKLTEIAQLNKHAEEIIGASPLNLAEYQNAVITSDKQLVDVETNEKLPNIEEGSDAYNAYNQIRKAGIFLENAELSFKGAFHQAYKYGTDEQKKNLREMSEEYKEDLKKSEDIVEYKKEGAIQVWAPIKRQRVLDEYIGKLRELTDRGGTPQVFQEAGEFAMDKAATTFGNLAKRSYDELGGKSAPMIVIEPFQFGAGLSKAEELKELVEISRKNFAKQLVDDGMNKDEAKKIAEAKLGITWDVGHMNIMKKYGFKDEDIVKATKTVAPMVKHVHLTDNFGFADSHLPIGMGNVPIKKIMETLEKTGRLGEMRKIVEAGGFVQHFKKSPHSMSMAAFGSPIYGMKAGPYWNQAMDMQGAYFGGYGTLNPQTHHSIYGAGFTTMPTELGGQMPGGTSRFGSTPMS